MTRYKSVLAESFFFIYDVHAYQIRSSKNTAYVDIFLKGFHWYVESNHYHVNLFEKQPRLRLELSTLDRSRDFKRGGARYLH